MGITIKDVARKAGVSVATASMALNNRAGVNALTRKKVLLCAKELNYVPNHSARVLVMQDSRCIGLLLPEIQNPFYSEIVDVLTQIVEQKGYTLLLGITNNSSRQEEEYVKMFISWRVCAVVVVPILQNRPRTDHLQLLRDANIPMVFCTERYADCHEPVVMCDYEQGQFMATRYLVDKGMKSFWFVSTDMDFMFARLRYEGYARALREAGIELDHSRELMLAQPRYLDAYAATDSIIERLPDAIICINDIMTMGIIKRLNEKGVAIPDDVSVMGFDDVMFSKLTSPSLTTVRQPIKEICEKTVELLESMLAEAVTLEEELNRIHLIQPELVLRATTI